MSIPPSRSRPGMKSAIAAVSLCTVALLVASMVVLPCASAAPGTFPKWVRGTIWDAAHRPVSGAQVTVQSINGTTVLDTQTDTTSAEGYYLVQFQAGKWDTRTGNHFNITATCPSGQGYNTTTVDAENTQWLNVTYVFEIAEFGNTVGLLATAGILGGVAAVAVVCVRRR